MSASLELPEAVVTDSIGVSRNVSQLPTIAATILFLAGYVLFVIEKRAEPEVVHGRS
jgi:hypothetical protein